MIYGHGDWFWVGYTLYSYILLSITTYFIFSFIYKNRKKRAYWFQGILIFIGGLIPWITSIIYITGSSPFKGLDIVPISTILSAVLFADSILRSSFLNLIPVARETLVETLPLGILALDRQNRIQDINVYARNILMIKHKDVLGMTLNDAMDHPGTLLKSIQSRTSPLEIEVDSHGEIRFFTITKKDIHSIPGSRLITIQDISDQIQRQQELVVARKQAEESDRLKSAFLANMSHEIRTPMNGIVGFVSLLQREDVSVQERGQYLDIIRNNCFRLLGTLNDIIDLSKIESGQMPIVKTTLDLNELIHSMEEMFQKDAESKHLDFHVNAHIPKPYCAIITDKNKLYSIVIRLIKNAIKYTNEGSVQFDCSLVDSTLLLVVLDSGIGIEESQQQLIFERFVQASDFSNRMFEGSGLGLSITKAYVEMLDGRLELTSEINKGSTFRVQIPV
jgi:signal transduction histidine kinase